MKSRVYLQFKRESLQGFVEAPEGTETRMRESGCTSFVVKTIANLSLLYELEGSIV